MSTAAQFLNDLFGLVIIGGLILMVLTMIVGVCWAVVDSVRNTRNDR